MINKKLQDELVELDERPALESRSVMSERAVQGIPLAIEIVAARVGTLGLAELAIQLDALLLRLPGRRGAAPDAFRDACEAPGRRGRKLVRRRPT